MDITKKGRARLEILIRFMSKLPASANRHFNMGTFFNHWGVDHHARLLKRLPLTRADLALCGTVACALGWAAVVPQLKRQGLTLTLDHDLKPVFRVGGRRCSDPFWAASKFFEMGDEDLSYLFGRVDADTPKQWARAARERLDQT